MYSDNQLIQLVKSGNQQAYTKLVLNHQDKTYSVCLSILKNKFEAQEAAQDTFIKVFKSIASFNEGSKLSSWIYKIAYRTSLDYIRKRKITADIDDLGNLLPANEESAQENMEHKELSQGLRGALEHLPADERGLIRMFYLEEFNIKELEEITGLSNSNIKVKLFRARKKLSNIIQDEHSEVGVYLE